MEREEPLMDEKAWKKLTEIIGHALAADPAAIRPETEFAADLLADSFDMAMLLADVDTAFGTAIPAEETERIRTVRDLMEEINSHPAQ